MPALRSSIRLACSTPSARKAPNPVPRELCCGGAAFCATTRFDLKQAPEKLVIDLVVKLHFGCFYHCAELPRTAVRGSPLQLGITPLHIGGKQLRGPLGFLEILDRRVNVVRQIPRRLSQILDLRGFAVEASLEDRIHHHIRIRVGSDGAYLCTHAALVADRDAHHGSAVDRGGLQLVWRLEMRIEPAISIHA